MWVRGRLNHRASQRQEAVSAIGPSLGGHRSSSLLWHRSALSLGPHIPQDSKWNCGAGVCLEEGLARLGSNGARVLRLRLSCPRGLEGCERLREQSWEKAGPPQRPSYHLVRTGLVHGSPTKPRKSQPMPHRTFMRH